MGNKASQEFQFAVSVDGGEGEWYQVLVKEAADAAAVEYHVVSGAQQPAIPSNMAVPFRFWGSVSLTSTVSLRTITAVLDIQQPIRAILER